MTLHDLKVACPSYHMFDHGQICERCKGGRLRYALINRCTKGSVALSSIAMVEAILHKILRTYERNVNRFIVPSKFYREKSVEWGWSPEHFIHIPNFVNPSSFKPDYSARKFILYIGRLSPEKGLLTLVQAAAKADIPLQIAGGGPQMSVLREKDEITRADITFLGHLSGLELHDAVRSARATVLPSEWYQNAPLSILEPYALGKPVIGAAIGGIPETIKDQKTGIIFESGSVESLASALRQIMEMPVSVLAEMGRCGRELIETKFSEKRYLDRIMSLYA